MPQTFRDIIKIKTKAEVRSYLTDLLGVSELPVTSWQAWSFPTRAIDAFTDILSDVFLISAFLGSGGYGATAVAMLDSRWLDAWAWDRFRKVRLQARFTEGELLLEDDGGGPHVIPAGGLIVATADGLSYQSTENVTVPLNGSATVAVRAVAVGAGYNIPSGTTLSLVTSFPGLVASNPSGGETWITQSGLDTEGNPEFYERAVLQWSELSIATPKGFYASKIMAAVPTITQVEVNDENPLGPGTAECICATGAGPASAGDIVLANSTLATIRSVGAGRTVARAAVARAFIISGKAYVIAAKIAAVRVAVAQEIGRLQTRLKMGGTVYASEVIRIVKSQDGVRDFIPAEGLTNLTGARDEKLSLFHEITYIAE